jgi:hypothetical protein
VISEAGGSARVTDSYRSTAMWGKDRCEAREGIRVWELVGASDATLGLLLVVAVAVLNAMSVMSQEGCVSSLYFVCVQDLNMMASAA